MMRRVLSHMYDSRLRLHLCCCLSHLWQALCQPHLIFSPDNTLGNSDLGAGKATGDRQRARQWEEEPGHNNKQVRSTPHKVGTILGTVSHACVYFDVVAVKLRDVSGFWENVCVCVCAWSDEKRIKHHNLSA